LNDDQHLLQYLTIIHFTNSVHGRPQDFFQGGANPEASRGLKGLSV